MASRNQLYNDAETSLRLALDGRQSTIWTALPAIIQSVDFGKMTCEAQPSIQGEVENPDGTIQVVNLPLLVDVPIVFPGAGSFILTFPLAQGDEVLVVFSSRCIDAWWQNGGVQRAVELRMHDLSDGFAFPGPKSIPNVIENISTTSAQLRNSDGTVYLEITSSQVNVKGNLHVQGNIVATGEVTGNGIALSTHTHPVTVTTTPSTVDTGAPQ